MKKIPIHVSDEQEAQALELAEALGWNREVYGWFPKVVKFSISCTLEILKNEEKHILGLNSDNLDLFLSSVARIRKKEVLRKKAAELAQEAEKV